MLCGCFRAYSLTALGARRADVAYRAGQQPTIDGNPQDWAGVPYVSLSRGRSGATGEFVTWSSTAMGKRGTVFQSRRSHPS